MKEELEVEREETFETGDIVRLTNRIVRLAEHKKIGPRRLMAQGWPNHFYVDEVGKTKGGIPVISLWGACCRCLEEKNGEWVCIGHPASYFEKIRPVVQGEGCDSGKSGKRSRKDGDRSASVVTPLGEIASYEYRDDDADAGLVLKIFGKEFSASGLFIKKLFDLGKQKGIL